MGAIALGTPTSAAKTGNGDENAVRTYSVPKQAESIFHQELLQNPLISKYLPSDIDKPASKVVFTGNDAPTLPVNWRFAESASALLALEAALVGSLLQNKYGVEAPEVVINRSVDLRIESSLSL
jgi:hypothetical protein